MVDIQNFEPFFTRVTDMDTTERLSFTYVEENSLPSHLDLPDFRDKYINLAIDGKYIFLFSPDCRVENEIANEQ